MSLQYHMLQTVFNDGRTDEELDKICDELFIGNRERYVKEE